eukprot:74428-Rhodomonas_salina.3
MVLVGSPRDAVLERRTLREHQLRIARLQRSLTVVHDDEPAWDSGMRPSWPQTLRVCAWFVCFAAQEAKAVALAAAAPLLQVKVCAPRDSCSSRDSGAHTCTPRKQTREHTDPYTSCQKRHQTPPPKGSGKRGIQFGIRHWVLALGFGIGDGRFGTWLRHQRRHVDRLEPPGAIPLPCERTPRDVRTRDRTRHVPSGQRLDHSQRQHCYAKANMQVTALSLLLGE